MLPAKVENSRELVVAEGRVVSRSKSVDDIMGLEVAMEVLGNIAIHHQRLWKRTVNPGDLFCLRRWKDEARALSLAIQLIFLLCYNGKARYFM